MSLLLTIGCEAPAKHGHEHEHGPDLAAGAHPRGDPALHRRRAAAATGASPGKLNLTLTFVT